jgi:hypothetical protein
VPSIPTDHPWSFPFNRGFYRVRTRATKVPNLLDKLPLYEGVEFLSKEFKKSLDLLKEDPTGVKLVEYEVEKVRNEIPEVKGQSMETALNLKGMGESADLYKRLVSYYLATNGLKTPAYQIEPISPN